MTKVNIYKANSSDAEAISECVYALLTELGMGSAIPERADIKEKFTKLMALLRFVE